MEAVTDEGAPLQRIQRPYCLRCYAPMERHGGASQACERCGFVNVTRDQEIFWTKEPRLVALEAYAKIWIVALLILISLGIVMGMGRSMSIGLGQGWAVGFPILLGVVLWDTASAITRRRSDHRPSIVWRVVCALLAPWPFLFLADLASARAEAHLGPSRRAWLLALTLVVGVALLAGALGLGWLGRATARWRDRHVLAAQRALLASAAPR